MLCVGEVQPDAVRNIVSLIIVKWVQCDKCEHLMLCTDVRVVRTGSEFVCVHCKLVLYIHLYCYHSVIINVIEINRNQSLIALQKYGSM